MTSGLHIKYVLSTYYVAGTVLGARNKRTNIPRFYSGYKLVGDTENGISDYPKSGECVRIVLWFECWCLPKFIF